MNIFSSYSLRSLKKNKMRSLVTVIGIILSMALLTAVIEGAFSGIGYLRNVISEQGGAFHVVLNDVEADLETQVRKSREVKTVASLQTLGWAVAGTRNEYKPYLLIRCYDGEFPRLAGLHLKEGRMCERENEILLPAHLESNGGLVLKTGDSITLEVGKRYVEGTEEGKSIGFVPGEEEIRDAKPMEFIIVGKYERLGSAGEPYNCPGFTALVLNPAEGAKDLFVELNSAYAVDRFRDSLPQGTDMGVNHDLLSVSGNVANSNLTQVIWGMAAILTILVCFGSVSLIYNSFAISINERTRQFGILKSVGATRKQIRRTVFSEAFFLALIGIPLGLVLGCAGIGTTLYLLRDEFAAFMDSKVQIGLILNVPMLLLSALLCLVTILISAYIPAKKAVKLSPIDSIRQTNEIRVRARDVKTSPLTQKLFGFEGMLAAKNFRRNRRSYRSVILSLFLSTVLFISASSFGSYLNESVHMVARDIPAELVYYISDSHEEALEVLEAARALQDVQEAKAVTYFRSEAVLDPNILQDIAEWVTKPDDRVNLESCFLDDESFKRILKEEGKNEADFYSSETPSALLSNRFVRKEYDEKGESIWKELFALKKDAAMPLDIRYVLQKFSLGAFTLIEVEEENGREIYVFYPEDYVEQMGEDIWDENKRDKNLAVYKSYEEIHEYMDMKVMGFLSEKNADLDQDAPYLLFPMSRFKEIYPEYDMGEYGQVLIHTNRHAIVAEKMRDYLSDHGYAADNLIDLAENYDMMRILARVVNVFAYGFIILISLIAIANVINTVYTNIQLRRREFAMLKSVGMDERSFGRMMNYECVIYGLKGLSLGLIASVLTTYLIYRIISNAISRSFWLPLGGFVVAIVSVFAVVFVTMLYTTNILKKENVVDALRNENL